jgi:hypothetical protein
VAKVLLGKRYCVNETKHSVFLSLWLMLSSIHNSAFQTPLGVPAWTPHMVPKADIYGERSVGRGLRVSKCALHHSKISKAGRRQHYIPSQTATQVTGQPCGQSQQLVCHIWSATYIVDSEQQPSRTVCYPNNFCSKKKKKHTLWSIFLSHLTQVANF